MNVINFPQLVDLPYVGLPTFTPSAYLLVIGTRLSNEAYELLKQHKIKVKFFPDCQIAIEENQLNFYNAILLNNIEDAKVINKQFEEINLLFMGVNSSSELAQGLLVGVKGFLSPNPHPEVLLNAIFSVSWGDYYIEQKCLKSKDNLNLLSSIERWTYWLASQVFFRLRNRSLACQQPPEVLQELGLIPKGENFKKKSQIELDLEISEMGRSWFSDLERIIESVKCQSHLQNPVDFCNSIKNVDGQLRSWSSLTENACLIKIEKKFLNLKKKIGKKFQDYLSIWRRAGAVNCLKMLKLLETQLKHLRTIYWQKSQKQQQLEREKRLAFVDELQNLENSSIFQQQIDNWQPSFLVKLKGIYLSKIQSKIYFLSPK
ncbi:hypothetical protein HC931_25780 [Candidatus Gracilibacteria bacterium]|nr:hypothetical protein [Candidatus Gracilibacteria bacterium]